MEREEAQMKELQMYAIGGLERAAEYKKRMPNNHNES